MLGDERCRRARRRDPRQLVAARTARSSVTTSSARSTARRRPATTSGRCSSTAARRAPAPARRRCTPATTSCGSTARPTRTSTARTIRSPLTVPAVVAARAANHGARDPDRRRWAQHADRRRARRRRRRHRRRVALGRDLTLHSAGAITLQARRSGATPSDPVSVCVYVHKRSECGSAGRGPAVHVRRDQRARRRSPARTRRVS